MFDNFFIDTFYAAHYGDFFECSSYNKSNGVTMYEALCEFVPGSKSDWMKVNPF